jgi:hypothetical protein
MVRNSASTDGMMPVLAGDGFRDCRNPNQISFSNYPFLLIKRVTRSFRPRDMALR